MIIGIDVDQAGNPHMIDTDATKHGKHFEDPRGGTAKLTILELLTVLNSDAKFREQGGWNVAVSLPHPFTGLTRWQMLVQEANSDTADADVKALGLKV